MAKATGTSIENKVVFTLHPDGDHFQWVKHILVRCGPRFTTKNDAIQYARNNPLLTEITPVEPKE